MNYIKRYKNQNAKGYKGIKRLLRQDLANLKWEVQYIWKKYIEYPIKGL
jgi:hypothetical protein